MDVDISISPDEIDHAFMPYVVRRYASDDPEWQAIVARLERKERRRFERLRDNEISSRDSTRIEQQYDSIWRRSLEEQLDGRPSAFEWSRGTVVARSIGRKRVHQLVLLRALEALSPRRVLEVGCGNGLNLLQLSAHFPDVRFAGLELTTAGTSAARALLGQTELHPAAAEFLVGSFRDSTAPWRVRLQQATAAQMPYRDGAFDVIVTVLALEQMESIRERVLAELRRVASRYVVMIEPFHELNSEGLRRQFIASNQYFDARIDALVHFGLRPVFTFADMPNKVLFHAGLVVAAVS